MALFDEWRTAWNATESDFSVVQGTSPNGDEYVEMDASSDARRAIRWASAGTPSDTEVLALVRAPSFKAGVDGHCKIICRGWGEAGSESAYWLELGDSGTREFKIKKAESGTVTEIDSFGSPAVNTWHWMRLRVSLDAPHDNTIKAKSWEYGDAEPGTWDISTTDTASDVPDDGWVGLGGYPDVTQQFDGFAVGTGGSAASMEANQVTQEILWETEVDWDSGQSEWGVHHGRPAGTDWSEGDVIEKGLPPLLEDMSMNVMAYYPLADPSGASTCAEVSGVGADGTYNGTTQNTGGPLGKNYRSFDGSTDFIDCGRDYVPNSMVGISAFVRNDAWSNSYEAVFSNINTGDNRQWALVRQGTNDALRLYITSSQVVVSSPIAGTGWRFVHAQAEEGGDGEMFLDGALDDTAAAPSTFNLGDGTPNHNIGRSPLDADYWSGDLAHVIVWGGGTANSLLTESEVNQIYQAFL